MPEYTVGDRVRTINNKTFDGHDGFIRRITYRGRHSQNVDVWIEFPGHGWLGAFAFAPHEVELVEEAERIAHP